MTVTTPPETAQNTLDDLLLQAKRAGATGADAVMFESTDIATSCRKGVPESMERAESAGLGLRVFVGQKQAIVSSSDLRPATMKALIERAIAMAKASPDDPFSELAPPELLASTIPDLDLFDGEEPTPEWLADQCKRTEDAALSVHGITNSEGAGAGYSANRITLATSNGFLQSYPISSFSFSVSVLAGEGTKMERDYEYSATRHRADLAGAETVGRRAAEKALARMNPRKAKTCSAPIVFDARIAKSIIPSYLSGAISGAAIARGTSFLKKSMGEQIFAPGITISDDPHIVRGLGSRPFDAEGVANAARNLVEDGVLQSWLLDVRAANKLGLKTLGDASRGTASPPNPSTSNLYVHAGTLSPHELMADIKEGLFVTDAFGGSPNLVTGDLSIGASGYWIENGELAYPVSEITIAGNLKDMYKRLTPANDLEMKYATNSPTIRIDGMTIAGA